MLSSFLSRYTKTDKMQAILAEDMPQQTWFTDLVLGGEDGLVNVLGLILGIIAANGDPHILIAAGFAEACSEAVSIGSGVYLSAITQRDQYRFRLQKETDKIHADAKKQREAVRKIFQSQGFKGKMLQEMVTTITSDEQVWRNILVHEKYQIQPVNTKQVWRKTFISGFATIIGSSIPVFPYVFFPRSTAIPLSILICGSILFIVGIFKAKTSGVNWLKSGIQMLVVGFGAALVGFLVGRLFKERDG